MMRQIKGFFFDLDGTLVDTHESNFRAYRDAIMAVTGTEPGVELKDYIKAGESSNAFLPKVVHNLNVSDLNDINQRKKELYPQHLHVSELNEYLSVFLSQMSTHYTTALVTTAKRKNALAVLQAHDLEKFFSFMVFGDDVSTMKPDPEAYLLALEKAGLSAEQVIAFEDSQKGIEAATAAGISTVCIKDFAS